MQACALFISASVRVGHVEPDHARAATAALDAAPRPGVARGGAPETSIRSRRPPRAPRGLAAT